MDTNGRPSPVRIAAAGDIHCAEGDRDAVAEAVAAIAPEVDALLLAGDLTTHGEPAQGLVLADACRDLDLPVVAVLGNHDHHADRAGELADVLRDAGVTVLERDHAVLDVRGTSVGVAGLKGFVGGFAGSHLPDFGEPLLRRVYAAMSDDVAALDAALGAIAGCDVRVTLLHYAPTTMTIEGERRDIWAFLGCDRLAGPIEAHRPHLVLHGHAHAGTFRGVVGDVPVFNVAVPVLGRDFCVFELDGSGARVPALTR